MKPQQKRLHDRLEQMLWHTRRHQSLDGLVSNPPDDEQKQELEDLVVVAQRLRTLQQIQIAPGFAEQLEQRILRRAAGLRLQGFPGSRGFFPVLRLRPVLAGTLACCLLLLVFGTTLLAFAAHVANPANPLYALRRLEQHVEISLAGDQSGQAVLELQFAHDSLATLSSLADSAHTPAYEQALVDLDQHLQNATLAINALPPGTHRTQLAAELQGLRANAVSVLRGLLPGLSLAGRLATTAQLGRLGVAVAHVFQGVMTFFSRPGGQTLISLSGSNLQAGAQLLVDGRLADARGSLQHGLLVFALTGWNGARHPRMLGILNPDGTVAQTTAIAIHLDAGDGNGNANSGNRSGNGNGGNGNGNKPTVTPTPHR